MNYFFGTTEEAPAAAESDAVTYATMADVPFEAFGKESVEVLLGRHTGEDGVTTWELVDDQPEAGAKVWRGAVKDSIWSPFRASRRISADKATIEKMLLDPELLLELDDMMEGVQVLKNVDAAGRLSLRHVSSKGVFPVAGREFVLITNATTLPDGRTVIASRSVPVQDVAPIEGYVRGTNIVSGYIIEEHQDAAGKTYCEVVLVAHADLSGYIPATVVNYLGTSATVKILDTLEATVTKK